MKVRIKFIFPHLSDTVTIQEEQYKVVEVDRQNLCEGCAFHRRGEPCNAGGAVLCVWDNKNYIFKKV